MKSLRTILIAFSFVFLMQQSARAGLVTLLAGESYQLSSNDVAEVLSVLPGNSAANNGGPGNLPTAILLVDSKSLITAASTTATVSPGSSTFAAPQPAVIAGPRTISALNGGGSLAAWSMVTLRVTDKVTFEQSRTGSCPALTAVIPNDPGNFNVLLEASSDLVTWHAVLPGSFGGASTNRFFRVRVERAP